MILRIIPAETVAKAVMDVISEKKKHLVGYDQQA
jgi:hypothetical protein